MKLYRLVQVSVYVVFDLIHLPGGDIIVTVVYTPIFGQHDFFIPLSPTSDNVNIRINFFIN